VDLWAVGFANFKSFSVHENHFDFCFFTEEIAVCHDEVGIFPFSTEPVRSATPKIPREQA